MSERESHQADELRPTMKSARVRVYGPLNDFLPAPRKHATFVCSFEGSPSVKDVVESLGVPHPEIDVLIVNGRAVDFAYRVQTGDRIAAYPVFYTFDVGDAARLSPPAQPEPRFVADVHLGRLAAYLRLSGFDTKYRTDYTDGEIAVISAVEDRTVLTRDVGLLKHRAIARGYFLRETQPGRQLVEVLRRFDLVARAAPFTRCLRCNSPLRRVSKDRVEHLLPPRTREHYREFSRCPTCERIYWQGSHYSRLRVFVETALASASAGEGSLRAGATKPR